MIAPEITEIQELPKTIGGYQHVCHGKLIDGDIWVHEGKPIGWVMPYSWVNAEAANSYRPGYSVYRKMAVPSNLDDKTAPAADTIETKPSNPKDLIGSNKIPMHLFPTTAKALGALALLDGALKYGRTNYRAIGVRSSIYYDACNRHLDAWFEGEDADPSSGLPHLAHALACIAVLIDAKAAGRLNDDRMYPGAYRKFIEANTGFVAQLKAQHAGEDPKHYTINSDLTSAK